MLNRAILVGRLTRDPDLRYTPNGIATSSFTLAVNRPFSNQQGEREADFINVVVWRKQAENAAQYLSKGSLAGVDGRIQTRSYENNSGQRVYVTEIVADSVQFLDTKSGSKPDAPRNEEEQQYGKKDDDPFSSDGQTIDISDDDLPF